jgi:Putative zinc-finger
MTGPAHDRATLGAYAIGALDPIEARMVHEHLSGCLDCQREVNELMMIRRALDQVPPEAFLDGPPADGDLLLRRTLRRVATETAPPRRSMTGVFVAAAAAVAVALGGGIFLGRETAPANTQASPPTTGTSTPGNSVFADGTNSKTGTTMNVAVEPKKGWVWVHATVTGLHEGLRCEIFVVDKQGKETLAGSWLVSADGAKNGTRLEGTALVPPADVTEVLIRQENGDLMVKVPV